MAQRPGPSYKPTGINWIHSMYGANDTCCTSDGTTSYLTMKSCIVPACSTSRHRSQAKVMSCHWVSLGTSPDFDTMYQQTRSYKSAPSRGMVSGLHRSGDAPVADVDHLDPPDLPRHGCNSDRGPEASGGPTVLANDRNGRRLRLNASRHDDDDDCEIYGLITTDHL